MVSATQEMNSLNAQPIILEVSLEISIMKVSKYQAWLLV